MFRLGVAALGCAALMDPALGASVYSDYEARAKEAEKLMDNKMEACRARLERTEK